MTRKVVKTVVLSNLADLFNGMATAWAFAFFDALFRFVWSDLLNALLLAILSFGFSVGMKLKLYDKHSRYH